MTAPSFVRTSGAAVLVATALLLGGPNDGAAQSWRAQAPFVSGQVAGAAIGAEFRRPIGPEPELPLPGRQGTGPIEVSSRNWHLTGMLGAGLNAMAPADDGGSEVEPLFYAHGGLLYLTGSKLVGYVGVVAAAYFPVGAVGPAALVEAADVIDIQVGALHADGAWHGHVALTVALRFLDDILGG